MTKYKDYKNEYEEKLELLTWRPSLLHRPLLVLVGAIVTTGGVFGTLWPAGGTRTDPGPSGPLLGVLTGELWLVAGDDTGEDSLLMEDAAVGGKREAIKTVEVKFNCDVRVKNILKYEPVSM